MGGGVGQTIETERLVLRPLRIEDAPFILRLLTQPSWLRFIGDRGVRDLESAERYLRDVPIAMQSRYGFALQHVSLKATGEPIGLCGILKRESLPDPDIGFALLDEHAGKGYGFEAATAVIADAEQRLGLRRLLAIATPDNERSARLLGALGFEPRGMHEDGRMRLFVRASAPG